MTPLHLARLESWALAVVERVQSGLRVEDSRVELKREWIDEYKAARRLAGLANAARGAEVLWIVGLDESEGLVGANPIELASWWPRVQTYFNGISPSLIDLALHKDGKSLCALVFSTSRAPYVVKNPQFGTANAGPIEFETPWREGTRVRSANRSDLLRILTPVAILPDVEVLSGTGSMTTRPGPGTGAAVTTVSFRTWLYLTPRTDGATVIPFHSCTCDLEGADTTQRLEGFRISLHQPYSMRIPMRGSQLDTATMERTSSELIAHGPGRCELRAATDLTVMPAWLQGENLRLVFVLSVVDADLPLTVLVQATPAVAESNAVASWLLSPGN